MKKSGLRIIKLTILTTIILLVIFYLTIWWFSPGESSIESYKGPLYYTNMNQKEIDIIDSVENLGYEQMKIYKPIMGLTHPYGNNYYVVYLKTNKTQEKEKIFNLSKSLAKELYKDVISDVFIYDIEYIYVNHKFCNNPNDTINCKESEFRFFKDSLENWCGFRVIKDGTKLYKRVKI